MMSFKDVLVAINHATRLTIDEAERPAWFDRLEHMISEQGLDEVEPQLFLNEPNNMSHEVCKTLARHGRMGLPLAYLRHWVPAHQLVRAAQKRREARVTKFLMIART